MGWQVQRAYECFGSLKDGFGSPAARLRSDLGAANGQLVLKTRRLARLPADACGLFFLGAFLGCLAFLIS